MCCFRQMDKLSSPIFIYIFEIVSTSIIRNETSLQFIELQHYIFSLVKFYFNKAS